jgi:predicted nuclease with TOPRIM domain
VFSSVVYANNTEDNKEKVFRKRGKAGLPGGNIQSQARRLQAENARLAEEARRWMGRAGDLQDDVDKLMKRVRDLESSEREARMTLAR